MVLRQYWAAKKNFIPKNWSRCLDLSYIAQPQSNRRVASHAVGHGQYAWRRPESVGQFPKLAFRRSRSLRITTKLRELIAAGQTVVAPGVFDGLSARIVEQA